jgi:hypothetical protein
MEMEEKKKKTMEGAAVCHSEVAEDVFRAATKCELGNGERLKFWVDQWIQRQCVGQIAPHLIKHVKPASLRVNVARCGRR